MPLLSRWKGHPLAGPLTKIFVDFLFLLCYYILVTQTEKKKIIEKLVDVPKAQKRHFWGREIKSLNILMGLYPEEDFWRGIVFSQKFDTLIVLRSGYYSKELKKKYARFKYDIPPPTQIKLGAKSGSDYKGPPPINTLRKFLS